MILITELQLGMKEQTIYAVDDQGNNQSTIKTELQSIPDTICGFYYAYNGEEVKLYGPRALCEEVEDSIKSIASSLYANNRPIKITIL